jgi:multiple sugar transport system ATP-binding protein
MTMADRIAVMRDGRILQIDVPRTIYDRPESLFVASFIGAPSMNLVRGHIVNNDGKVSFVAGGVTLPLDEYAWSERPVAGRPVVFGLRPEDICPSGGDLNSALALAPILVEPTGSDLLLRLPFAGAEVTARVPRNTMAQLGRSMEFAFNLRNVSVFCAVSERRI